MEAQSPPRAAYVLFDPDVGSALSVLIIVRDNGTVELKQGSSGAEIYLTNNQAAELLAAIQSPD